MYLDELLDELVATYQDNRFVAARPFIKRLGKLWNPRNLAETRSAVTELLIDAYDHRAARHADDPMGRPTPWHWDSMAVPQLEALLARALASQGDTVGARFAMARAFGTHQGCPGWQTQLEALTIGRLSSRIVGTETAFDSYWLAVRRWMSEGETDLDLLAETFCELAMLGHVSPRHPRPVQWAQLVAMMTEDRPDDEWKPGRWFEREFRAAINWILEANRRSADERESQVLGLLPELAAELQMAGETRLAERVHIVHAHKPHYAQLRDDLSKPLSVGRKLGLPIAHQVWAFWRRPRAAG